MAMYNKDHDWDNEEMFNPEQVLELAKDTTTSGRSALTRMVSQIFKQELTEQEKTLASAILLQLIEQAELDLKEALSERLSISENIPSELIIALAHDNVSVAEPVLLHSPVLSEYDLIYLIRSKGSEYWRLIAQRQNISEGVTDTLIETEDKYSVLHVLDNETSTISRHSIRKVSRMAIGNEDFHEPLLRRPELDSGLAMDLYLCVSRTLRNEILKRFPINPQQLDKTLDHILQDISNSSHDKTNISREMRDLAYRFNERKEINPDLLIKTLRRGQMSFFMALFAIRIETTPDIIERILKSEGGKALAVACHAMGVVKSEFASVFLLSRGIRTSEKIVDQRELASALKAFDSITEEKAKTLLNAWKKKPESI